MNLKSGFKFYLEIRSNSNKRQWTEITPRLGIRFLDVCALLCVMAGSVGVSAVNAAMPFVQQQKLTASDGAENDQFGSAVALSSDGNTAIVGADNTDVGGNIDQGAAYVYTRSGDAWTQQV